MGGRGGSGPRAAAAEPAATPAPAAAPSLPLTNPALAARILQEMRDMGMKPGDFIRVRELREKMGVNRTGFDEAMRQMSRREEVVLVPVSNRKAFTSEDIQGGVYLGGEWRSLMGLR